MHIPTQRKSQIDIVNEAKILQKDKKIQNSSFEAFVRNTKNCTVHWVFPSPNPTQLLITSFYDKAPNEMGQFHPAP